MYHYKLILDDAEAIIVKIALEQLIDFSKERISAGDDCPHYSRERLAMAVLKRLRTSIIQTDSREAIITS